MFNLLNYLLCFTDKFEIALALWPIASFALSLPILAFLYHRDGRLKPWSAIGAYLSVLYLLALVCFTLYPLPSGTRGPGVTYGVKPNFNPLQFIFDIRAMGKVAAFQLLANVAFFVPLGFIELRAFGMKFPLASVLAFFCSLTIETTQLTGIFGLYPYSYRMFDVNDLMTNTIGGMLGWGIARVVGIILPVHELKDAAPTRNPGFVRRLVAFLLDLILILTLTAIIGAGVPAARRALGLSAADADMQLLFILLGSYFIVELVIPIAFGGCTPGGSFVRMTTNTADRFGWRRIAFAMLRAVVLAVCIALAPILFFVMVGFYLGKRCMPYDLAFCGGAHRESGDSEISTGGGAAHTGAKAQVKKRGKRAVSNGTDPTSASFGESVESSAVHHDGDVTVSAARASAHGLPLRSEDVPTAAHNARVEAALRAAAAALAANPETEMSDDDSRRGA